jgi:hypothetical protein
MGQTRCGGNDFAAKFDGGLLTRTQDSNFPVTVRKGKNRFFSLGDASINTIMSNTLLRLFLKILWFSVILLDSWVKF